MFLVSENAYTERKFMRTRKAGYETYQSCECVCIAIDRSMQVINRSTVPMAQRLNDATMGC